MSSPLASSSRHNLPHPRPTSPTPLRSQRDTHQQQSLRFLLSAHTDSDDDGVENRPLFLGMASDDSDSDIESDTEVMRRAKRARLTHTTTTTIKTMPSLRSDVRGRAGLAASPSKRMAEAAPSTPTKKRQPIIVKGNVTPSKAFSIFKRPKASSKQGKQAQQDTGSGGGRPMTPPPSSPAFAASSSSQPSSSQTSQASQCTPRTSIRYGGSAGINGFFSPGNDYLPPSSMLSASSVPPVPLAVRHLMSSAHPACTFAPHLVSVQDAIWSLKTRRSVGSFGAASFRSIGYRPRLNANAFLASFVSPPSSVMRLPLTAEGAYAHPLCSSYSYSSRSVYPSAQWLAVGDDQGRLSLLNTLICQDVAAEEYTSTPSWLAVDAEQQESVFELSWRFDDRVILSGGSDYVVRSWDVEYQRQVDRFEAHWGSPRSIVWDPTTSGNACGNVFASAGRDGAIHLWDARVGIKRTTEGGKDKSCRIDGMDEDEEATSNAGSKAAKAPVLSIWSAHTTVTQYGGRGRGGRSSLHSTPSFGTPSSSTRSGGRTNKRALAPKGVTSLCYLPDGNGHRLVSAGCENGVLKCWDLRTWSSASSTWASSQGEAAAAGEVVMVPEMKRGRGRPSKTDGTTANKEKGKQEMVGPSAMTADLTMQARLNRRSHGISHVVATADRVFAAATDGRIYNVAVSALLASPSAPSSSRSRGRGMTTEEEEGPALPNLFGTVPPSQGGWYDAAQRSNTLYAKMALYDDRFLALGCNTGQVGVWDLHLPTSSPSPSSSSLAAEEEIRLEVAREWGYGFASSPTGSGAGAGAGMGCVTFNNGHALNAEVNSLSWCNGPDGPVLSTVGDDAVVRSWFARSEEREEVEREVGRRVDEREWRAKEEEW